MKSTARTPMRVVRTPHQQREMRLRTQTSSESNGSENIPPRPKDPVSVFCRVRPLPSEGDLSCITVKNSTTIVLTPPEQALGNKHCVLKETQCIFKHVFEARATQQEVFTKVAQPLVENLIRGRNSLLFTYGVTGSGKTFTMTGDIRHRGIMPRCLDVLFRTISDYQTKKYVFKPDRLNGFEILSEADALLERQQEMNQRFAGGRGPLKRKDSDPELASQASCEMPPLQGIDEDNMYAVFITYVEVYNNSVYDLLEDGGIQKSLQSKIIREDANHNMYVHGVTEVEIKSVEEAIEYFQIGQKRKRMGHTVLNAESSRSHSVFNIRLVQAPTDCQGENVVQDKRTITVSQLSLVDLAGSERSSRTKNTGMRLREAGNINNSLMTLRTCLEYLRENQLSAGGNVPSKKVPYRDAKITHLFKNYFDGEGQVSMIVCVNPRAEDFEENTQVIKFAEMTQEVQIARATPMKADLGLTPGRRKANKLFKIAVNNLNDLGYTDAQKLDVDVGLVYTLGPNFPEYNLDSPEAEDTIEMLMQYLVQRIEKRKLLCEDLDARLDNFRSLLMQREKENLSLRTELASLKAVYKQERDRSLALENKIRVHESSIDVLNNKLGNRERQIDDLTRKLRDQQNLLNKKEQEKEHQKKKFDSKLAVEVDRRDRLHELKHAKLQNKIRVKDEKLKLLSNIITSDDLALAKLPRSRSIDNLTEDKDSQQAAQQQGVSGSIRTGTATATPRTDVYSAARVPRGMAAANRRHRRSRSAGEKWIEHRAQNPVPLGTVLQPYLKNRKSITKLTDMKDLTGHNANKYMLVSQEADTDGDVETKLFKGNIVPTCGGGAQVIFDDVECLKQKSPVPSPNRKRPINTDNGGILSNIGTTVSALSALTSLNSANDVASRCNVGIEGHTVKRTKV
ncbi:kinesin-like protein KIF23 [Musca domestica]|uniref:Kinesin-like protein n=2 Tax=Musca domestica TaxID=7370 RepID=A0A1I8N1C8_MUSDO|nr:kinesin-like protein KIF23 [Musca domestica]